MGSPSSDGPRAKGKGKPTQLGRREKSGVRHIFWKKKGRWYTVKKLRGMAARVERRRGGQKRVND